MLFIYWLEEHPVFAKKVEHIRNRMSERHDELITSSFTIGEVLAGVFQKREEQRAKQVRALLLSVISEIVPFTEATADHYARIRGVSGVRSPDAIHLASAAQAGTDLFLTNDKQLVRKIVPGVQFIASLDTDLF